MNILCHEGSKYIKRIFSCFVGRGSIEIDVYNVIDAYKITCPAQAHALKKVLCAGERGKGSRLQDLNGAIAALHRAIELENQNDTTRDATESPDEA